MDSASDSTEIVVADPGVETGGENIFSILSFSVISYFLPAVQVEFAWLSLSMK